MPFKPNIDPKAKPGLRIKLLKMYDDPRPVDSDMEGTINYIDSMGTIHVTWDDGRSLGVLPGVDDYLLYPPADQQITDIDSMFEDSMPKPTLKGSKSTKAGKNVTKNWKSALSKSRVRDIKIESEDGEIEETSTAGGVSTGAFMGPLTKKESRIIKFKDLIKEVNTKESGLRDGGSFDGNAWVGDKDGDGWNFNDKPIWTGGEIVDILTKKNINWKDDNLSVSENKIIKFKDLIKETTRTNNDKTTGTDPLTGHAWADKDKDGWYFDDIPAWEGGEIVDILADVKTDWTDIDLSIKEGEGAIHTKKWDRCVKKVKKNSPDVDPYAVCTDSIGYEGSIKKDHRRKDESLTNNKHKINESFSWLLTGVAIWSFYKFIKGIRGKGGPSRAEREYGKSDWKTLYLYVTDYLKKGGKIKYEENYLFHVFEAGDLTIKINKENNTIFWTHLVPDIKRFLKYKTSKRLEFTDIDVIEHEYTEPISISQDDIDDLVDGIKEDLNGGTTDEPLTEGVSIRVGDPVMYKGTKSIFKRIGKPGETAHIEWNDEEIEVPIKHLHPVEELDETTTFGSVWGSNGPPVTPAFAAKDGKHTPSKKAIYKGGKIIQKIQNDGVLNEEYGRNYEIKSLYDVIKDDLLNIPSRVPNSHNISNPTLIDDYKLLMSGPIGGIENFMVPHNKSEYGNTKGLEYDYDEGKVMSKGPHGILAMAILPKLKEMGLINGPLSDENELNVLNKIGTLFYNDIIPMLSNDSDEFGRGFHSIDEVNTIKWVSGGKFVKIKDKCAKFNNQPWCDAGNASNPLELSDTTFNNVSEVSKKLGIPESVILERIKLKLQSNK